MHLIDSDIEFVSAGRKLKSRNTRLWVVPVSSRVVYDHSGLYSNDFTHLTGQNTTSNFRNNEIHVIWRVRLIFSTTAMSDIFAQSCWTLTNFLPGIEKVSDSLDFSWIDQQLNIHGRVAITVLGGKFI